MMQRPIDPESLKVMGPGSTSGSTTAGDARPDFAGAGGGSKDTKDTEPLEKSLTPMEDSAPSHSESEIIRQPIPLSNLAEGIVGWESQEDPEMPFNFPTGRKWLIIVLLSTITFFVPFASAVQAPSINTIMVDLGEKSATMATVTVSIYLLGYVIGPLFLAPLSEIYGRRLVLDASNSFFVVWQIGCAMAPNTATLIVARFFSGLGGAGCNTIGPSVVGDLFRTEERGLAMGIFSIGPLFGPTVGPLVGAYVSQSLGWRWDFWLLLIASAPAVVLGIFFNAETNHGVLIARKVRRLQDATQRADLRSCYASASTPLGNNTESSRRVLGRGLLRPLTLLFTPLVFSVALYTAFGYGAYYLLLTTIGRVFSQTYGWSVGQAGLVYLSLGFGGLFGLAAVIIMSDRDLLRRVKESKSGYEPEMRLPLCMVFALISPVTFFIFGWAAEKHVHWAVPLFGLFPFTFAMSGIFQILQVYLVDCYEAYSATAVAASVVFRSILGATLPIAGPKMFDALGLGWGCSLLGFIWLALVPTPLLLWRFGKQLRLKSKVSFAT